MIQLNSHLLKIHRASEIDSDRWRYIGLDRNERVMPLSDQALRRMLRAIKPETLCHYPDLTAFYKQLSKTLRLPSSCLYATPGSDAAIRMVFQAFVRPHNTVIFPSPSYAMYDVYGRIFQANVQTLPYDTDLHFDVDRLWRLLQRRPRLLLIANPDQPTGSVLNESQVLKIVRYARKVGTLVVIDEAYYPFYPRTVIRHVRQYDNLIVTRSFSKAGGLAGLRLGYLAANPRLIDMLTRVRGAFEVNAVAFALGTYLLKHPRMMRDQVRTIEKGRAVLLKAAEDLSIECPPCRTSFQLMRFPGLYNTASLVARLKQEKYLVKGTFAMPALWNCIRVTLAGPEVMRPFAAALQRSLKTIRWTHPIIHE